MESGARQQACIWPREPHMLWGALTSSVGGRRWQVRLTQATRGWQVLRGGGQKYLRESEVRWRCRDSFSQAQTTGKEVAMPYPPGKGPWGAGDPAGGGGQSV